MNDWKIFYGDNTSFSSSDGNPEDAPCRNVQVIVVKDEDVGRLLVSKWDFYYYKDDTWFGCDIFGLWDYLADPGLKIVKFGRTLSNEEYDTIIKKAIKDKDFPIKTSWKKIEKRSFN